MLQLGFYTFNKFMSISTSQEWNRRLINRSAVFWLYLTHERRIQPPRYEVGCNGWFGGMCESIFGGAVFGEGSKELNGQMLTIAAWPSRHLYTSRRYGLYSLFLLPFGMKSVTVFYHMRYIDAPHRTYYVTPVKNKMNFEYFRYYIYLHCL